MRQRANAKRQKFILLKDFLGFFRHHWVISITVLIVFILVSSIAFLGYIQYSHKLSKQDFDALSIMAERVIKNSGGNTVAQYKTCSYERKTELSPLSLYCTLALVSYLPYTNDATTLEIARQFSSELLKIGKPQAAPDAFYAKPADNTWAAPTNLNKPYPQLQCRFAIATKRFAKTLGIGIPGVQDDNLVALDFYCSAESRAEYFPVTYRQG